MLSHVPLFEIPWTAARQVSLSFTISRSLVKGTNHTLVLPLEALIPTPSRPHPSPPKSPIRKDIIKRINLGTVLTCTNNISKLTLDSSSHLEKLEIYKNRNVLRKQSVEHLTPTVPHPALRCLLYLQADWESERGSTVAFS